MPDHIDNYVESLQERIRSLYREAHSKTAPLIAEEWPDEFSGKVMSELQTYITKILDEVEGEVIGIDYDMDWFDGKTGKERVWTAIDIMKQVNAVKARQRAALQTIRKRYQPTNNHKGGAT